MLQIFTRDKNKGTTGTEIFDKKNKGNTGTEVLTRKKNKGNTGTKILTRKKGNAGTEILTRKKTSALLASGQPYESLSVTPCFFSYLNRLLDTPMPMKIHKTHNELRCEK